MAKTKAFSYFLGPVDEKRALTNTNPDTPQVTTTQESSLVNQASPTWVLTFVRWSVRDTLRALGGTVQADPTRSTSYTGNIHPELLSVRRTLVVENDCVQLSVTSNKGTLTPSMNAVLVETDVNYSTSVAPGDFVFVNILNWEQDARRIATIANGQNPQPNGPQPAGNINGPNDGFKGVFKVQSVRKTITMDAETGLKRVLIRIDGYAFTEFNNMIYFNPYLARDTWGTDKDGLLFISNISTDYAKLITPQNNPYCQDVIRYLIMSFIGKGLTDQGTTYAAGSPVTANTQFYVPPQVGRLLGVPGAAAAKDIYNYLFGVQLYSSNPNQSLQRGMNPSNLVSPSKTNGFQYTNILCEGQTLLKPEYWNQTSTWSILNQYTNSPLNELYACFRISSNGYVMPTLVFRQIPFTSDYFGQAEPFTLKDINVTKFSSLPRWKMSSAYVYNSDIGRDEAARINFVQFYVQPPGEIKPDFWISAQTVNKNYVHDINDVMRSGLRPSIITSNFEDLTITSPIKIGRVWANIIGDALIGAHLKMNGTIECVGIVDPITVGDNLEFDDIVFHIEEVTHMCSINPQTGIKSFRTNLKLSHGVSVSTTSTGIVYPEMQFTNAYHDRQNDYNNDQILPGVSEEQDILSRQGNVSPPNAIVNRTDAPFAQPGQIIIPNTPDEDNE